MADVEEMCNRVAIIDRGRILFEGDTAELIRSTGTWYHLRTSDQVRARELGAAVGITDIDDEGEELRFTADEPTVERYVAELALAGIGVRALVPAQATLEQLFFQLTESDAPVPAEPRDLQEALP